MNIVYSSYYSRCILIYNIVDRILIVGCGLIDFLNKHKARLIFVVSEQFCNQTCV